jgi:hypothetical protein
MTDWKSVDPLNVTYLSPEAFDALREWMEQEPTPEEVAGMKRLAAAVKYPHGEVLQGNRQARSSGSEGGLENREVSGEAPSDVPPVEGPQPGDGT